MFLFYVPSSRTQPVPQATPQGLVKIYKNIYKHLVTPHHASKCYLARAGNTEIERTLKTTHQEPLHSFSVMRKRYMVGQNEDL